MEFCLNLSHHSWAKVTAPNGAVAATLDAIRVADQAGLDSVWVSEDPDGWDAFAVLGAAAPMTERIRLGTGVTNPYLRHPNLLAMSVATIDRLSGGRAFLGLGRGQPEWYGRALGIEVGSPLRALEDAADLVRQWWTPPHTATGGEHFHVASWSHAFGPERVPPIYLAAVGPRALRLAARKFDGLLMTEFSSEAFLERIITQTRTRLVDEGRSSDTFPVFVRTAIEVTDNPERALAQRKNLIALINALPGMAHPIDVPGFDVPTIMARVREVMHTDEVLAAGGGFIELRQVADFAAARRLIPTELVDAVSYVGSAEKIREKLRRLAEIGVTHVFVSPSDQRDAAGYAELIASVRPESTTQPPR
ncbi:MAG TPA: LLM class flavin-dependent oxidoreductase [Nitrolancea sp.]|nr:LLM class flavin-dependent oxidoreductase [Nitrolancea sp.]